MKDLKVLKKALLGKWLWRFGVEVNAFWRGVIVDKYGAMGGEWRTRDVTMPFGCGLWRNILNGWDDFKVNISFKVGDGRRVRFWGHRWCGDNLLKDDFPSLHRISCQRELTIHQFRGTQGGETFWDLSFRRGFNDCKVTEFQRLLDLLHRQVTIVDIPDTLWRDMGKNGMFSVKSY